MRTLSVLLFILFTLSGCYTSTSDPNRATYEESRIVFELTEPINLESLTYPTKITLRYYLHEQSPLYGTDAYYTWTYKSGKYGKILTPFALSKVDSGYKLLHGSHKGFIIPESGGMDYRNVFSLPSPNGTIELEFKNADDLDTFVNKYNYDTSSNDAATVRKSLKFQPTQKEPEHANKETK